MIALPSVFERLIAGSVAVVLNKIDELSPQDAQLCLNDCARLLAESGLTEGVGEPL